jgi:sulfatase modifying factor 1
VIRVRRWLAALILLPACNVDADIARIPRVIDSGTVVADVAPKCAPGMIDLGDFCIDATEVTKGSYKAFLDSKPGISTDPRCSWNGKFEPTVLDDFPAFCTLEDVDLVKEPNHPVVCVDWCDAFSYCAWAGKRLCGMIGGGSEPYKDPSVMNDVKKSQWYAACAGGEGTPRKYPYRGDYQPVCNDKLSGGAARDVGSMPGCHGPPGTPQAAVYDMSGNVYEWVDNCQASAAAPSQQSCLTRGGFYLNEDVTDAGAFEYLTCAVGSITNPKQRERFDDHIGIRCCSP